MARLDTDRQEKLEPKRIETALLILKNYNPTQVDDKSIQFEFNGNIITYWPYSGWHSGKGIKDGRGLVNLMRQLV